MTKKETKNTNTQESIPDILVENETLASEEPQTIPAGEFQRMQELEQLITSLKEENKEMNDKMLREVAEAQNFKKRLMREKEDAQKYAVTKMAKELLNVLDNLGRAVEAVPEEHRTDNDFIKNLLVGVEATEADLVRIFEQFKIKQFKNDGEKFDPNIHRVMFEQEDATKAPGTIIQVVQPGYMIEDRLLREALVGVSKKPAEASQEQHMDEKI